MLEMFSSHPTNLSNSVSAGTSSQSSNYKYDGLLFQCKARLVYAVTFLIEFSKTYFSL